MHRQILLASLLVTFPLFASPEPDHEIHQELRGILTTVQGAINSGNYAAMLPVVSEDLRATTITQEVILGRKGVVPYFTKWFGPGGYLKKLDIQLSADVLTELSPDKTWGIVVGSATEGYTLTDGRRFPMKSRWTATVAKESDGRWRLRAIHFGTNFLDNPILDEAGAVGKKYTVTGVVGGLVVGLGLGFLVGRRKRA
jgi:ketosteroid isomerase-like protein